MSEETITLGGGCFWCVEAAFLELEGVKRVEPGYAGGHDPAPNYRAVCQGTTGHAEVVRVAFDPEAIPLEELLRVFFTVHDPTTLNRQGADVGSQYRSIVLFDGPGQEAVVRAVMAELAGEGLWEDPMVTEVKPLEEFFPAEAEHLNYYNRNQYQPYCQIVISPKIAKVRAGFAHRLKSGRGG